MHYIHIYYYILFIARSLALCLSIHKLTSCCCFRSWTFASPLFFCYRTVCGALLCYRHHFYYDKADYLLSTTHKRCIVARAHVFDFISPTRTRILSIHPIFSSTLPHLIVTHCYRTCAWKKKMPLLDSFTWRWWRWRWWWWWCGDVDHQKI